MSTTLTDTGKRWRPGEWIGATVVITSGTGAGQVRGVVGNTETTLVVDQPWDVVPVNFSYRVSLSLLTGVERGVKGTTPEAHPVGSLVLEVTDFGYRWIVAGHPCAAVRNVKVDGVPLAGGYTVNLRDTTLVPGRTLTTVTTPPPAQGGVGVHAGSFAPAPRTVKATGLDFVEAPSWLRRVRAARVRVFLSITIDAGSTGYGPGWRDAVRIVIHLWSTAHSKWYPFGSFVVAEVVVDSFGRLQVTRSVPTVLLGGQGDGWRAIWITGGGDLYVGPGGFSTGVVGSAVVVGVEAEYDYFPEDVNPNYVEVPATPGRLSAEAAALFEKLRRVEMVCDVDGYADDEAGTVTGTPNSLIELPGDIDRHFITQVLGEPESVLDAASYAATREWHVALGYRQTLVINTPARVQEILWNSALQSRCWVYSDGAKLYRVFLDAGTATQFRVLARHCVGYPEWRQSSREAVTTRLRMLYGYRWAPGIYMRVIEESLPTVYPQTVRDLSMPMIPLDESMARDVYSFVAGWFSRTRRVVTCTLIWTAAPVQPGDVIEFVLDEAGFGGFPQWDDGVTRYDLGAKYDGVLTQEAGNLPAMWLQIRFRVYRVETSYHGNLVTIEAIEI